MPAISSARDGSGRTTRILTGIFESMGSKAAILITGGAGYIGSHCSKAVAEAGFLPVCYDNLTTGHRSFAQWGPLVVGDVADSIKIAATIRQYDVHAVMHFAASSAVGESVANPQI